MVMAKKAFAFTVLSITLLAIVYLLVAGRTTILDAQSSAIVASRASSQSVLVEEVTRNYVTDIFVSQTHLVLDALAKDMNSSTNGRVFGFFKNQTDFNNVFSQAFIYAKVNGQPWNMNTVATQDLLNNFSVLVLDTFDAESSLIILNDTVRLLQQDPWSVTLYATVQYNISADDGQFVDRILLIEQKVPLLNITDPFIMVYTKVQRKIVPNELNDDFWNLEALTEHFQTGKYRQYDNAPSYLQRFWNDTNFSNHSLGIETLLTLVPASGTGGSGSGSYNHTVGGGATTGGGSIIGNTTYSNGSIVITPITGELFVPGVDHVKLKNSMSCNRNSPPSSVGLYMYYFDGLPYDFYLDHNRTTYYLGLAESEYPYNEEYLLVMCP